MSLPRGRIEKMVPTEILLSRLADPSSGSIATQKRRRGIEDFRQLRLLGQNGGNRRAAQRAPHHVVGGDIDILLLVAVGIDAAVASGDAGQRPVGDQRRQVRSQRRRCASITAPTAAPCGVCDADRSRCERRVTRSSMVVSLRPLRGALPGVSPFGDPQLNENAICRISKILLSLVEQSFSYEGDERWQAGSLRELTIRQLRALAAVQKTGR